MKTLITLVLFLASIFPAGSDESSKSEFLQTVEKNWWRTIQIGASDFVGDYFVEGPFLYFQRLPDKRILLSSIESTGRGNGQPFPVRFVTDEEFLEFIDEVDKILAVALDSENDAPDGKNAFGNQWSRMGVSLRGNVFNKSFGSKFDGSKTTVTKFKTLLSDFTGGRKAEPRKTGEP